MEQVIARIRRKDSHTNMGKNGNEYNVDIYQYVMKYASSITDFMIQKSEFMHIVNWLRPNFLKHITPGKNFLMKYWTNIKKAFGEKEKNMYKTLFEELQKKYPQGTEEEIIKKKLNGYLVNFIQLSTEKKSNRDILRMAEDYQLQFSQSRDKNNFPDQIYTPKVAIRNSPLTRIRYLEIQDEIVDYDMSSSAHLFQYVHDKWDKANPGAAGYAHELSRSIDQELWQLSSKYMKELESFMEMMRTNSHDEIPSSSMKDMVIGCTPDKWLQGIKKKKKIIVSFTLYGLDEHNPNDEKYRPIIDKLQIYNWKTMRNILIKRKNGKETSYFNLGWGSEQNYIDKYIIQVIYSDKKEDSGWLKEWNYNGNYKIHLTNKMKEASFFSTEQILSIGNIDEYNRKEEEKYLFNQDDFSRDGDTGNKIQIIKNRRDKRYLMPHGLAISEM